MTHFNNPFKKKYLVTLLILNLSFSSYAQDQLYKVTLLRAAPGRLLELIDAVQSDIDKYTELNIEKPYLMRHSQGDHWDLMLIYPFSPKSDKTEDSRTISKSYGDSYYDMISSQEEGIFTGPDKQQFNDWFTQFDYYHVEIFTALAGKQKELLKQREMENIYLKELNRRPNHIFTRVMGPSWDIFTIGYYEDIKDYANAGDIDFETEDQAAKKAGFEGVKYIGSYLRSLILEHHDTLAGAVR